MTLLIGLAIRSSIMLGIGLLLSACLAKRSAALRHRVLAASLLAAALVMPFSLTLPGWTVTLPLTDPTPAETSAPIADVTTAAVVAAPSTSPPVTEQGAADPATTSRIAFVWLAGALVNGALLIAGLLRVGRVAARAARIDDTQWLRILDSVANRYGLTRRIVLSRTASTELLGTWGILRPQVLVPDHAREWTLDRVRVVLCHELAHIRRHDWPVLMAAEALRAVLWFNPLAWMVCTRLRRESEQACDDEVLGMGVGSREYASQLLDLARQCRRSSSTWAPAIPMAHPSTLERRIAAMLNPRLDRQAPSRRAMATLAIALLLVAVPIAALRARQTGPAPLSGTVYDVTGAVLPGVEVALVDANQNRWVATSSASGRFELPAVGAGKYVLEASLAGFRSLRQDFELRDPRDWDRAVTLQVGELSETVRIRESRVAAPTQPASAEPARTRVGGNIRAPRKVKDVRPTYPASMRDAGLTGVVPLEAIIGRDGTVSSIRVLSAQVHPDLAIAAADAVRQWRFTPTLLNGQAVEVVMTVSIQFDLEG